MRAVFSITIRSPEQQAEFDLLRRVLTDTLGLDWRSTAGFPDGHEIATDCAEDLWDAGFRIRPRPEAADNLEGR